MGRPQRRRGGGASVLQDERVLEMDGGGIAVGLCLMPLGRALRVVKVITFMLCIFHGGF